MRCPWLVAPKSLMVLNRAKPAKKQKYVTRTDALGREMALRSACLPKRRSPALGTKCGQSIKIGIKVNVCSQIDFCSAKVGKQDT